MKVILSSNRNPHFITIAEYIEDAFRSSGCETLFFSNNDFVIPGRIRDKVRYLQGADLKRMNKKLITLIESFKPDLFVEAGGHRILPETLEEIKKRGTRTALWTIDCPINFRPIIKAAPHYDIIFTGGSEAYDILKDIGIRNLYHLPFACDPEVHTPKELTGTDREIYGCDISFVGTIDPGPYQYRVSMLETIAGNGVDLAAWGPGSGNIPHESPLKKYIRGEKTPLETWTKIYSSSKIVLCMHYRDADNKVPCHQASPRVYEALACGAFLMVDAQRDVMTLFKDREDLVIFRDEGELKELSAYYLERPEERARIAEQGRRTALEKHTYKHRIEEILEVAARHE